MRLSQLDASRDLNSESTALNEVELDPRPNGSRVIEALRAASELLKGAAFFMKCPNNL